MYLRVLDSIHAEIGDNLIVREQEITKRNNLLKDLIRERDVSKLTQSWHGILEVYSLPSLNTSESSNNKITLDIIETCLKVIGGWVSWIDITLIVNPSYLSTIFSFFQTPSHKLTTCDTLLEIISKKMKPGDKLELLQLLELQNVISQLSSNDLEFEERVAKLSNVIALELIHILDGSTASAARVPQTPEISQGAEVYLINFMPIIIRFLSNEYDDTSSQVFPCISEYLGFVRFESKQEKAKIDTSKMQKNKDNGHIHDFPPDSTFISPTRREILSLLLSNVIIKMKYDSSVDWTGGDDESESEFLDIRGRLKILQDQIASIDIDLYIDGIVSVVTNSFNPSTVTSWQDVELGLFELSAFSESLKNGAVAVIKGVETRASRTLFELFFKMIESNVVSMNHPSIQLHYMELVNRHSMFFSSETSDSLSKVLECFVSPLGVHSPNKRVQVRAWYLFFRFVKSIRGMIGVGVAETVFSSLEPVLRIKAELPSKEDDDSEISGTEASGAGAFDSQLYLFELCGILISNHRSTNTLTTTNNININNGVSSNKFNNNKNNDISNNSSNKQSVMINFNDPNDNNNNNNNNNDTSKNTFIDDKKQLYLMRQLLQPIYRDVEAILKQGLDDPLSALQVHHNLMAIGTFARGFNDVGTGAAANSDTIIGGNNSLVGINNGNNNNNNNDAGVTVNGENDKIDETVSGEFKIATRVVITSLEEMGKAEVIRDAARFSISRLIPVLGSSILPEVTRLISCLLELSKLDEIVDFLGFLGQLVHNFRKEYGVYEMFDTLMIPLFSRISAALKETETEASGGSTDAIILMKDVRKGYLSFLFNILNNGMGALLFSKTNSSIYEPVLQSLLNYSTDVERDAASSKIAILILNKMLITWGNGVVSPGNYGEQQPVPGFQEFTMQHISRITWEIPTRPNFNPKDAQMRSILGDLATVQQTICQIYREIYLEYLSKQYFPSVELPLEYRTEYLQKIQTCNAKEFKVFYNYLIRSLTNKN